MKKLLLLILFASVAFGQSVPLPPDIDNAIAGTVNFEVLSRRALQTWFLVWRLQ